MERTEHSRKAVLMNNMGRELEEEGPKAKIHFDSLRTTSKKYQIGKHQAMTAYMDTRLKSSLPSMIDRLPK